MHAAEIVVSLEAAGTPHRRRPATGPVLAEEDDEARRIDVGSAWAYLVLNSRMTEHDRLLAVLAPSVQGRPWYFVRYIEDHEQLRVRVRSPLGDLEQLFDTARALRAAGAVGEIAVRSYDRELERYGGAESFRSWEESFCTETPFVLASLADRPAEQLSYAAGMVDAWLSATTTPDVAREVLTTACAGYLTEHGDRGHALLRQARSVSVHVTEASTALAAGLSAFWADSRQAAARRDSAVVQAGLHMFCNRLGLDRAQELVVLRAVDLHQRRVGGRNVR